MQSESFHDRSEEKMDAETWALTIAIALNVGCGITPEAKESLVAECKDPDFRASLHRSLWDMKIEDTPGVENCAQLLGLKNPLEFPPDWFN